MASNNVKIVIQEDNKTAPRGSGVSSDVAYVPGLAYPYEHTVEDSVLKFTKYSKEKIEKLLPEDQEQYEFISDGEGYYYRKLSTNTPIMCSTLDEFEAYFGKCPYSMTSLDLATSVPHNYNVGDYDRSYIYAKELINAGMAVLYENITAEGIHRVAHVDYIDNQSHAVPLVDRGNSSFTVMPVTASEDNYTFQFHLTASPVSGAVKILLDKPEGIDLTITDVTTSPESASTSGGTFSIVTDEDTPVISWNYADDTDFKYTSFVVTLHAEYAAAGTYTFGISVVPNDAACDGGENCVCGSRIEYLYQKLPSCLNRLEDKNEYSVKYITSGGYPTFFEVTQAGGGTAYSHADNMMATAAAREDAVALIDHLDDPTCSLTPTDTSSVFAKVNTYYGSGKTVGDEFSAMFTPWGRYSCSTITDPTRTSQLMPASFGYLMCVATAIKTSPNWLAMAGVTRGVVPNLKSLHTNQILSNVIAEEYQPKYGSDSVKISVNAITNVKPYGLTIWGNRTLEPVAEKGTTALNFLNTRNMISDIKKLAYSTAKSLMFEQDSNTLWLKFKSGISPLLDQLKSGFGISDYKIIKGTTKYNGQALTRGEMAAVIKIFPLYAIEYFEITVVIADNDVTVQ